MSLGKPTSPQDLPCDLAACKAPAGEPCTETAGTATRPIVRPRERFHLARVHRFERASADWERLEKLRGNSSS